MMSFTYHMLNWPIARAFAATLLLGGLHFALAFNDLTDPTINVALQWNDVAVTAVKATGTPPTVAARALFIVHSAVYDAWAAYEKTAAGTLPGSPARQPQGAFPLLFKASAVSYAAYRTLLDLFPSQAAVFKARMVDLGYDPSITTTSLSTPPGVGNAAAAAQIAFRHSDGSNQLGDLGGAPYSDYTGYQAVNFPDNLTDPNHWQPIRNPDGTVQRYLSPHWGKVTPFALKSASQFRPGPPPLAGTWLYNKRLKDTIALQAGLDDRAKASAEYWEDGPGTETPPGHWNRLAQEISNRDKHTLDDDVKMFFALNAAQFDVSVAVWEAKRTYDAIRPASAIRYFYAGQNIMGFAGKGNGMAQIDGSAWNSWVASAPHPEFPSGHSAFSNASAEILRRFTDSDSFAKQVTFAAGSSRYDAGSSPAQETTLDWLTFSEIAEDASLSRRLGGIHFDEADIRSRIIGRQVAGVVWDKYQSLLGSAQQ